MVEKKHSKEFGVYDIAEAETSQSDKVAEAWAEFLNTDPEHFIWGIDPNDVISNVSL